MISPKSRLVIIDDEEVVLDSCKLILRNENYEITTASNGESGIRIIEEDTPDLVFVDLKMPGISGFEVLKKINEIDPNIVTIVLTGFSTVSSAVEAMKNGAYDFLSKPFLPDEFRLITRRGLEKRKLVLETIKLKREKGIIQEQFAAIVSHELKSPLSVVQQNLYLLEQELAGKLSKDQIQLLEKSKSKINDLLNLIHTWLRVISVDINQLKDNFIKLSIENIVSKAVENHYLLAQKKGLHIEVDSFESFPLIQGDEGTLVEAVGNLLANAIKFSHQNGEIFIKGEINGEELEILVIDQGVGISKEDIPYIFDDFYSSTRDENIKKSSGIGLAITRRIIEAHGGEINVMSEFGQGSTFIIKIPIMSSTQ
jgi:two-component system, sensor histidine kinase and response regulator